MGKTEDSEIEVLNRVHSFSQVGCGVIIKVEAGFGKIIRGSFRKFRKLLEARFCQVLPDHSIDSLYILVSILICHLQQVF